MTKKKGKTKRDYDALKIEFFENPQYNTVWSFLTNVKGWTQNNAHSSTLAKMKGWENEKVIYNYNKRNSKLIKTGNGLKTEATRIVTKAQLQKAVTVARYNSFDLMVNLINTVNRDYKEGLITTEFLVKNASNITTLTKTIEDLYRASLDIGEMKDLETKDDGTTDVDINDTNKPLVIKVV